MIIDIILQYCAEIRFQIGSQNPKSDSKLVSKSDFKFCKLDSKFISKSDSKFISKSRKVLEAIYIAEEDPEINKTKEGGGAMDLYL